MPRALLITIAAMIVPISLVADVLVLRGGRLYLGIHDEVLTDNSGAFRVTVYY